MNHLHRYVGTHRFADGWTSLGVNVEWLHAASQTHFNSILLSRVLMGLCDIVPAIRFCCPCNKVRLTLGSRGRPTGMFFSRFEGLLQDLRYTFRTLRKDAAFTAFAV